MIHQMRLSVVVVLGTFPKDFHGAAATRLWSKIAFETVVNPIREMVRKTRKKDPKSDLKRLRTC